MTGIVLADITNNILRKIIEPPVKEINIQSSKTATQQARVIQKPKNDIGYYSVIYERNLFNSSGSPLSGVISEGPAPLSKLNAKLIGTVVSEVENFSFAVILNTATNETGIYHVNDMLLNEAKVLKIERSRVIIFRNGVQESLVVYEEDFASSGEQVASLPQTTQPFDVRQEGANRYVISKDEVERSTQNLGKLMTEARLVPNLEGGKINGYKIFAIKPDSLYTKIGLQNGDIIYKVNGIDISDPERAFQLFQQLKNERYFQVEVVRNNQRQTLTYQVQ
jgi:general secretion pathway protein C